MATRTNPDLPQDLTDLVEYLRPGYILCTGERHSELCYTVWILDIDNCYTVWVANQGLNGRWSLSPYAGPWDNPWDWK
jgi:hypothetical protein